MRVFADITADSIAVEKDGVVYPFRLSMEEVRGRGPEELIECIEECGDKIPFLGVPLERYLNARPGAEVVLEQLL